MIGERFAVTKSLSRSVKPGTYQVVATYTPFGTRSESGNDTYAKCVKVLQSGKLSKATTAKLNISIEVLKSFQKVA